TGTPLFEAVTCPSWTRKTFPVCSTTLPIRSDNAGVAPARSTNQASARARRKRFFRRIDPSLSQYPPGHSNATVTRSRWAKRRLMDEFARFTKQCEARLPGLYYKGGKDSAVHR